MEIPRATIRHLPPASTGGTAEPGGGQEEETSRALEKLADRFANFTSIFPWVWLCFRNTLCWPVELAIPRGVVILAVLGLQTWGTHS